MFHLSNLTPRLNKVYLKREKSSSKTKRNDEIDKLSSSLVSLRNDLVELLKSEFKESANNNRNFTFDFNFSNSLDKILIKTSSVWQTSNSYVSSGSFNLDKNSTAFTDNQRRSHYFANGGLNKVNRLEVSFFSNHQTRTFKTYRSLISDSQRNPTILSRLKEAYSQPGSGKSSVIGTQTAQTIQSDSLTKLLSQTDDSLTPEQKQQLKIAFAEGYLAANSPENAKKDSRAMKILKVSGINAQQSCYWIQIYGKNIVLNPTSFLDFPAALDHSRFHGNFLQSVRIQQRVSL